MNSSLLRSRLPFVLLAMGSLLTGLWSGLIRIGWPLPLHSIAVHHGAIMVGGFFTTLITLEKAIPLKNKVAFIAPVVSALSMIMILNDYFYQVGLGLMIAGSVALFAIQSSHVYKSPNDRPAILMAIGAVMLVAGNLLLLTSKFYPSSFPLWMGFILFTIVGERLELSKFLPVPVQAKGILLLLLALFGTGLVLPFHGYGKYLSGAGMFGASIWLLQYDVIMIGLKSRGLTKYSAAAMLLANLALLIEGVFLIILPNTMPAYDTLVHTFFIGFGFTMVFAHGPIILPAVLKKTVKPYSPILYIWLILLQSSLYMRIFSNAIMDTGMRSYSGLIAASAILLYFVTLALTLLWRHRNETPS